MEKGFKKGECLTLSIIKLLNCLCKCYMMFERGRGESSTLSIIKFSNCLRKCYMMLWRRDSRKNNAWHSPSSSSQFVYVTVTWCSRQGFNKEECLTLSIIKFSNCLRKCYMMFETGIQERTMLDPLHHQVLKLFA
jgi:hypothetical protein